jgi:hypothetical protein
MPAKNRGRVCKYDNRLFANYLPVNISVGEMGHVLGHVRGGYLGQVQKSDIDISAAF